MYDVSRGVYIPTPMASFFLPAITSPGVQRIIIVKSPSATTCLLGSRHEKAWSGKFVSEWTVEEYYHRAEESWDQ